MASGIVFMPTKLYNNDIMARTYPIGSIGASSEACGRMLGYLDHAAEEYDHLAILDVALAQTTLPPGTMAHHMARRLCSTTVTLEQQTWAEALEGYRGQAAVSGLSEKQARCWDDAAMLLESFRLLSRLD
jgi:hypothetical protein